MSDYYVDTNFALDLSTIVAYFYRENALGREIEIHLNNGTKYIANEYAEETKRLFKALQQWHKRLWQQRSSDGIAHVP